MRASTAALVAVALLATAAAPAYAPRVLRRTAWFRVQRVEISGTRLLAPHAVLSRSGVRAGQSLWEDLEGRERALRADPAILEAHVSRRLPATLRIRVTEKRPIAFVEDGALDPVTAEGEVLPLDPARSPIDLPVIRGPWSQVAPAARRALLHETDRLLRLDPALLAEVAEIRPGDAAVHYLVLRHRTAEIVLPLGADSERLAQLREVLTELRGRLPAGSAAPPPRVDLRFQDQIVVRLPPSV